MLLSFKQFLQLLKSAGICALSSDALSGWSWHQPDTRHQNDAIREATALLVKMVVPEFARRLEYVFGVMLSLPTMRTPV